MVCHRRCCRRRRLSCVLPVVAIGSVGVVGVVGLIGCFSLLLAKPLSMESHF